MVHNFTCSLFYDTEKGIYTTIPRSEIDFHKLIEIYQSPLVKHITEKIRVADEQEKKLLKKQLPFITPYGTFKPSRQQVNISHFNKQLLCLDIDGLKENEVELIKAILIPQQSTLLCAVSPRGKGIKALVFISDLIPLHNCYNTLKLNIFEIAEKLELSSFIKNIDFAQFKPTQPWFISFDENLYFNYTPQPLNIKLIEYKEFVIVDEVDFDAIEQVKTTTNFLEPIDYRINQYFFKTVEGLIKFFACCGDGNRHSNIIKVQIVASWIHYAPQLEDKIKEILLNACCSMYGSRKEAEQNNVPKSFEKAWNTAPIKRNDTIEQIINDKKYNVSVKGLISQNQYR
jgi:hypothetical protein